MALPRPRRRLLLEAANALLHAWWLVRRRPFRAYAATLGQAHPGEFVDTANADMPPQPLGQVRWALHRLNRLAGGRFTCLMLAIAGKRLLDRRGLANTLVLGVRPGTGGLGRTRSARMPGCGRGNMSSSGWRNVRAISPWPRTTPPRRTGGLPCRAAPPDHTQVIERRYYPEDSLKLYHLYGLAVASEFDCPELTEITPEQAAARNYATVHLTRAQAPLTLPEGRQYAPWMRATRDACLYEFGDIARMLVERPDRITVEMLPGAVESDMRAYLFGTGFGTLVHMRGLIPLHIAAIQTPEGVVAYTGPSGAGKSTKVAELHFRHGWPIICDDVAVLHPDDETPLLHAGVNRIKLWKDAVERFGIDPSRLTRDIMRHDKYHLHAPEMFVDGLSPWTCW